MKVYPTERLMHAGEHYAPGDEIECDENDAAAMIGSGRATAKQDVGRAAKKQFDAEQKAAA
jgi:hypothetical protein